MLPLFFKLSVKDVKDKDRWMPIWKQHANDDKRIDVTKWSVAVKALCKTNGLEFGKIATKEVAYRKCIIQDIFRLSPPDFLYGSFQHMIGYDRMCKVCEKCLCFLALKLFIIKSMISLYQIIDFCESHGLLCLLTGLMFFEKQIVCRI